MLLPSSQLPIIVVVIINIEPGQCSVISRQTKIIQLDEGNYLAFDKFVIR